MNDYDFLSLAIGFAAAAPLGILAVWFVSWRARSRLTKWRGYNG
jgi:hypothetical protein